MLLVSYQIDRDDRIVRVDDSWSAFAVANGAPRLAGNGVIGTLLWDHISDQPTQAAYIEIVERIRLEGVSFSFPFRCDSPDVRRYMQMDVVSAGNGSVCFMSRVERVEAQAPLSWPQGKLENVSAVAMCTTCRRVASHGQWRELDDVLAGDVPLAAMGDRPFSHALCPDCLQRMGAARKS